MITLFQLARRLKAFDVELLWSAPIAGPVGPACRYACFALDGKYVALSCTKDDDQISLSEVDRIYRVLGVPDLKYPA